MEMSGHLHALAAFTLREIVPLCPLDKRLGGPQTRYGRCGEEKNLEPAGNQTPVVQSITGLYTD
jgi:hypothetical protein